MATSVSKPHVVVAEKDSEEEDMSDCQEGSSDGGDEEGSGEDSADGDVDDGASVEESADGDSDEEGPGEDSSDGDSDEEGPGEDSADRGDEEAEDENEENPNSGWADAMARILRKKTPEDKPCILLKSKQQKNLNEKERKVRLEKKKKADKKRTWEMMCRVKPDVVQDREKEKNLQRTATRGVVQLFNAVRQHQKKVDEKVKEVGGSERKRAKVLSSVSKKDFIDVLKGSAGCTTAMTASAKPEKEEKPAWSVLRDDFMMGSNMKDWDKESDAEPGGDKPEPAADLNSDSD